MKMQSLFSILKAAFDLLKSGIWGNNRGAAAVVMVIGILPTLTIGLGAVKYAEINTTMTRLQQTQMEALYAVTKEGPENVSKEGERQGKAWMDMNLSFLKRPLASFDHKFAITEGKWTGDVIVNSSLQNQFLQESFVAQAQQSMRAWHYYRPIEVSFAVAIGYLYRNNFTMVKEAVEEAMREIFLDNDSADDAWVSVVFSGQLVNVGVEYGEKLINRDSAVPYYDMENWDNINATNLALLRTYRQNLQTMLQEFAPHMVDNLFQPGAPGYDINMVCFYRQPLSTYDEIGASKVTEAQIEDYVERAVFSLPRKGFDMTQGLAYPRTSQGGRPLKNGERIDSTSGGAYMIDTTNRNRIYIGYQGSSFDNVAIAHKKHITTAKVTEAGILRAQNSPNYWQWGSNSFSGLTAVYDQPFVSVAGGCPRSPMIAGAQDVDSVRDVLNQFGTTAGSAHDEALAWALRMMEPDYSDVWGVSDYPAPYKDEGGNREKRLIFLGNSNVDRAGYIQDEWGNADTISHMCKAAKERGIDIYMGTGERLNTVAQQIYDNCAPADRQFDFTLSTLKDRIREACRRNYRVRLQLL